MLRKGKGASEGRERNRAGACRGREVEVRDGGKEFVRNKKKMLDHTNLRIGTFLFWNSTNLVRLVRQVGTIQIVPVRLQLY